MPLKISLLLCGMRECGTFHQGQHHTHGIAMPLSPEQEELCERLGKGESVPSAAALILQQANEIDDLWDRLSRAYALVRQESPAEMIQEEMKQLQAMLEGRRNSQSGPG
jgi:hypothetical protein